MRTLPRLLLVSGAVLFLGLVFSIGLEPVAVSFTELSWRLPLLLVFPFCIMTILDVLGWRFAFRRGGIPFRALLSAWIAGETFNVTTPTASLGGEAVKAWLVRSYVPLGESIPSVIIAKTTVTIGQALFLALGIVAAAWTLPAGSSFLRAMRWLLVLECVGTGAFVAVQAFGAVGVGARLVHWLGLGRHGRAAALGELDHELTSFYRREPRRLASSILCYFLSWVLGVSEAYIVLQALGIPVPLATAARLGELMDEPLADMSFVPLYLLARAAKHSVTVALTGDGGDELFVGYPTLRADWWHQGFGRLPAPGRAALGRIARRLPGLPEDLRNFLQALKYSPSARNQVLLGGLPADRHMVLLAPAARCIGNAAPYPTLAALIWLDEFGQPRPTRP